MESINGKEDEKTTNREHYSMNIEEDRPNNHGVVMSKNNTSELVNVEGMDLMTSINDKPSQLESMASSSDAQRQDEVKKSRRRRRRHSFRSNNSSEGGGSSHGSESPLLLESESVAPGAYHERGYFAGSEQSVEQQDGPLYHGEGNDSDLIEEGNSTLPPGHLNRPAQDRTGSGGSQLPTDTDLNSLVLVDSTPDSSNLIPVLHAHVVVEESLEERLAAEIEALQAEFRGQVEQEVHRTLGAIATAEVVAPNDGNDILPGNNNEEYHPTSKMKTDGEEGLWFPCLATCCTKWQLWVTLLLLLLTGATVGIVIGVQGGNPSPSPSPAPAAPPVDARNCQKGLGLDGEAAGDMFGYSVAISSDGNHVAIGAPYNDGIGGDAGCVRIVKWSGSQWEQVGSDLDSEEADAWFGWSVALSSDGNRVAIGAPFNNGNGKFAGHVRILDLSGSQWVQVGSGIDGVEAFDLIGGSVALSSDGNRVAIGVLSEPGLGTSSLARIYDWSGSNWTQVGSDFDEDAPDDQFGYSVALSSDGSHVAIGAPRNNGIDAGYVRIFDWSGSNWTQLGADLAGEAAGAAFGYSVALSSDGSRVAIGATSENGNDTGYVCIFHWIGSNWTQVGPALYGEVIGDAFGRSVALSDDGNRVAISAPNNDDTGDAAGKVIIFDWSGSQWVQVAYIAGGAKGDFFGASVALSGDGSQVAIGAPQVVSSDIYGDGEVAIYNLMDPSCL